VVAPLPHRIGVDVKQLRYITHSEESAYQLIPPEYRKWRLSSHRFVIK